MVTRVGMSRLTRYRLALGLRVLAFALASAGAVLLVGARRVWVGALIGLLVGLVAFVLPPLRRPRR